MLCILILGTRSFDLAEFSSFQIAFNGGCSHYLTLIGETDYLSLSRSPENITLLVGRNDINETFTSPWQAEFLFAWPEMLVNGQMMSSIERNGIIKYPLSFSMGKIQCKIYGLITGSFLDASQSDATQLTYQCPTMSTWKIYLPSVLTVIFSALFAATGFKIAQPSLAAYRNRFGGVLPVRYPPSYDDVQHEEDYCTQRV